MPATKYLVHKPLADGFALVRRTTDGELLLAQPFNVDAKGASENDGDDNNDNRITGELVRRGAGKAAARVLRHENLVSIHDDVNVLTHFDREEGDDTNGIFGKSRQKRYLLWDWCDAGTLDDLLRDYSLGSPSLKENEGFLPESLVWHVALGVLRAFAWLHEGIRWSPEEVGRFEENPEPDEVEKYERAQKAGSPPSRCPRDLRQYASWSEAQTDPEPDWMPILHRAVRAENIFLQHARRTGGIETYAPVKLGGLSECYVSGTVSKNRKTPLVALETGDDFTLEDLEEAMDDWDQRDISEQFVVERENRPYTQTRELFHLGGILYHMMVGKPLPGGPNGDEECVHCGTSCVHVIDVAPLDKDNIPEVCDHAGCPDVGVQFNLHSGVENTRNIITDFLPHLADKYTLGLRKLVGLLLKLGKYRSNWANDTVDEENGDSSFRASDVLEEYWGHYEWWAWNTEDGRLCRDEIDDLWFRKVNLERQKEVQLEVAGETLGVELAEE